MKISAGKDNVHFSPVEVRNVEEFLEYALHYNWSPSLFKDDYRSKENFLQAESIGVDIDNDEVDEKTGEPIRMTLEEARTVFAPYKHIIMPSKSHRKEKNGKIADRFRVLLFLSRPITGEREFYATWFELQRLFPAIDPSCKDPSRFYYPSKSVVSSNMKGKTIDPVTPEVTELDVALAEPKEPDLSVHGELSRKTLKFMLEGAPGGRRHRELYKAARDYHQNNYSREKFLEDLQAMITRTGNWTQSSISQKDRGTIDDAFGTDPKHGARTTYTKALLFEPVSEILNTDEKFEWLVDGLLSVGGISVFAGDPKAGKSTLSRQLALSIARGTPFLGRNVKQGPVFYTALEEQRTLLRDQLRAVGITEKDPVFMHVGSPLSRDVLETLEDVLSQEEVRLLVIDTFQLGLKIKELQNYTEVNEAVMPFRDLARDTGTHILFIHHNNKSGMGSNAISGSKAIAGAMDSILLFKKIGRKRFLTTEGRGVKPWYDHELIFDEGTQSYCLGQAGGFGDEDDRPNF